ncbi:MAG: hypothetical protein JWN46_2092 [Acidimicrobiales bacterium]|nr:hypothetical protein [Acidimicrobiales bacterium]
MTRPRLVDQRPLDPRVARRHRARSGRGQRGAVLVEFGFVAPILVLLLGATFDLGMAWRASLAESTAARAGARLASAMGTAADADWYALSGARSSLSSSGLLAGVQKVIIYRADATNGVVPPGCVAGSLGSSKCVVLTGDAFRALTQSQVDSSGCVTTATISNWCSTNRINSPQASGEYYGMWLEIRKGYMFPVMGSGVTIHRWAVMRLEPPE